MRRLTKRASRMRRPLRKLYQMKTLRLIGSLRAGAQAAIIRSGDTLSGHHQCLMIGIEGAEENSGFGHNPFTVSAVNFPL
ncbi:hypothetical protein D3M71_16880 [Erwinia billingiae]|nr:hypothetical protein [Erwinia billingiae]